MNGRRNRRKDREADQTQEIIFRKAMRNYIVRKRKKKRKGMEEKKIEIP